MTDDQRNELIDRILYLDWGPGWSLHRILDIHKISRQSTQEVYDILIPTRLFESISERDAEDGLRLSPFGRDIKNKGGWRRFLSEEAIANEAKQYELLQKKWIYRSRWFPHVVSILSVCVSVILFLVSEKRRDMLKQEVERKNSTYTPIVEPTLKTDTLRDTTKF